MSPSLSPGRDSCFAWKAIPISRDTAGAMSQENVDVVPQLGEARSQPEGVAKSDDSVQVVRRAWEAWERGDMQAVFDFYDPAI